jgi:Ca2+/H+ antiporter
MGLSVIPFIIAQFPKMLKTHHGQRLAVLLALIASFLLVLSYCLYQVFQPWIQRRKLAYAKHKHVISGILRHAQMQALGRLLNDDGTPNDDVIRKLFHKIDLDKSRTLSQAELHALIVGINFEEVDFDRMDAVEKVMDDFDTSRNDAVEEEEFVQGMKKWLNEAKRSVPASGAFSNKFINEFHERTRQEHDQLIDRSDEAVESVENPGWCIAKAVGFLLLGAAIAAAFADPLVDTVHNFSNATHIPSFFISFIALPLATNSSEAVSAIIFASRKKQRTCSLTFSEVPVLRTPLTMTDTVTPSRAPCIGNKILMALIRLLAGVRRRDDEQHAVPGRVPGAHLLPEPDMGLLVGGAHHPGCVRHHGPLHQLRDHVPALDLPRRLHALSPLAGHRLHPRLRLRLVIGSLVLLMWTPVFWRTPVGLIL